MTGAGAHETASLKEGVSILLASSPYLVIHNLSGFPDRSLLLAGWLAGGDNNKLPKMVLKVCYQHRWVM